MSDNPASVSPGSTVRFDLSQIPCKPLRYVRGLNVETDEGALVVRFVGRDGRSWADLSWRNYCLECPRNVFEGLVDALVALRARGDL